jgi:hypothetical protein
MSIRAASRTANFCKKSASIYYHQYLKDNNMEIPEGKYSKRYTQDDINKLIHYIVDDKMSITEASKKANMDHNTGHKYYRKYLKDHHLDVPIRNIITQEQKSKMIGYIVDEKMTIKAAAKKANMSCSVGHKHYHQYLKDRNLIIPFEISLHKNKRVK